MHTQYTHTEPLVQSNYQHCIWLGTFICNNEEIKCKLVFPVNSQSDLSIVHGGGVGKRWIWQMESCLPILYHQLLIIIIIQVVHSPIFYPTKFLSTYDIPILYSLHKHIHSTILCGMKGALSYREMCFCYVCLFSLKIIN